MFRSDELDATRCCWRLRRACWGPNPEGVQIGLGLETDNIVEPSHELALALRSSYEAATGMPRADYYLANDGLDTRDNLGGLNLSTIPKVFIECANLRNAEDVALVEQPEFRQKAAQGIFNGPTEYFAASG